MNFTQITNNWNAQTDKYARIELTADTTLNVTTGDSGILKVTQNSVGGHKLYIQGRKRNGSEINLLPNSETLLCFINVLGVLNWDIMPTELNELPPTSESPILNLNYNNFTIPTYNSIGGYGGLKTIEIINIAEPTRIDANGNIKAFKFYIDNLPISGTSEFYIKVWRNAVGIFSIIHKVVIPISAIVVGENEYTLPSSIATLQGDYIGAGYTSTVNQSSLFKTFTDSVGSRYNSTNVNSTIQWLTKPQVLACTPIIAVKE